jgi:ATP-dependent RNA helicase DHX37/DHR1
LTFISQAQASLSSSVLYSSASLGTGNLSTHQQLQEKAEDREIKKAFIGLSGKRKRHQDQFHIHGPDEDDDVSEVESPPQRLEEGWLEQKTGTLAEPDANAISQIEPIQSQSKAHSLPVVVGSALQRNPDGSAVAPKIYTKSEKQVPLFDKIFIPDAHYKLVITSWLGSTTYYY